MPSLETLTENDLRGPLNDESLRRARGYLGQIHDPVRRGQVLSARVQGSNLYQVEVMVSPGGIHARCSCPYSWGGYCKHVGAVLLKWLRGPETFAVESPAATLPGYPLAVIPVEPPSTQRPDEPPGWLTEGFEERQQRDRQQLAKWLEGITLQDLRAMARQRGWTVRGTRKSEVIDQIVAQIDDAGDLRQAIAGLDQEHGQVLRALVMLGDDEIESEDVAQVAGTWGKLKRHKQIETYTRHLWGQGLALPGRVKSGYGDAQVDFVPPILIRHFPSLLQGVVPAMDDLPADSAASGLRPADPLALVRAATQLILLLEQAPVPLRPPMPRPYLERFHGGLKGWDYDPGELARIEQEGLLVSRSSGLDTALSVPPPARPLPDEAVARLAPIVGGKEHLDFLYALLRAGGIVQPGSPITVWAEVKAGFLRRDELAQRALLARLYFDASFWSELWPVLRADDGLRLERLWRHSYLTPERLRDELVRFRKQVLRVLAALPDDRWIRMADLEPLLRATWPRFDATRWETYYYRPTVNASWFLSRNGHPLGPDDADDWRAAQGAFVRQVIVGPLHWLGLADLYFDDEQLIAFRLHGLALLYWDGAEAPGVPGRISDQTDAASVAQAVTADEFRIAVDPAAVSAQAHSLLTKIARLEVTEPERFVYRLDAQAAYLAFEKGAVLDDLLLDWQRLLAIPMPAAIREKLAAWWRAYGRVHLYENLSVIEFGDDYALAEVRAATSLDRYLVAEISPRLVIVRPDAVEGLVAELEKAGYTPKQTDEV